MACRTELARQGKSILRNRDSGIKAMLQALREANLEPPRFNDRRASFRVTLRNHTLMNPGAIAWLNKFSHLALEDRQRVALVYLGQHGGMKNSDYRRPNRVDELMAGQELRGLVQTGLVEQRGVGRGTYYTLKIVAGFPEARPRENDEERILDFVRQRGSINNTQCRELLGVEDKRAWYLLQKLTKARALRREGEGRWSRYTLS